MHDQNCNSHSSQHTLHNCAAGVGDEHAKWSPVATTWYRLMPEVVLLQQPCGAVAQQLAAELPGLLSLQGSGDKATVVVGDVRKHDRLLEKVRCRGTLLGRRWVERAAGGGVGMLWSTAQVGPRGQAPVLPLCKWSRPVLSEVALTNPPCSRCALPCHAQVRRLSGEERFAPYIQLRKVRGAWERCSRGCEAAACCVCMRMQQLIACACTSHLCSPIFLGPSPLHTSPNQTNPTRPPAGQGPLHLHDRVHGRLAAARAIPVRRRGAPVAGAPVGGGAWRVAGMAARARAAAHELARYGARRRCARRLRGLGLGRRMRCRAAAEGCCAERHRWEACPASSSHVPAGHDQQVRQGAGGAAGLPARRRQLARRPGSGARPPARAPWCAGASSSAAAAQQQHQ